jgi:hypothetical protein
MKLLKVLNGSGFATIVIVVWSIIIAIIILRTYSPSRDEEKNLDV